MIRLLITRKAFMKRLYKIIIFFVIIFCIGIYFTIQSINNSFQSEDTTETIALSPSLINNVYKG